MLNLEQKRNRLMFMTMSTIISIALTAILIQGINAVGVLLAAAIVNIFVYYALPNKYSESYSKQYLNRRQ
jgi:O-antigen/teichoic acid export membrane protein